MRHTESEACNITNKSQARVTFKINETLHISIFLFHQSTWTLQKSFTMIIIHTTQQFLIGCFRLDLWGCDAEFDINPLERTYLMERLTGPVLVHYIVCCVYGKSRQSGLTVQLTNLPLDKMAAISQTIFSNAFSWMKRWQAIIWINANPIHRRICAALDGGNELM